MFIPTNREIDLSIDKNIIHEYTKRYQKFGATPKGSFWLSKKRQYKRFEIILKEIQKISNNSHQVTLADIGCGYGAMAEFLISKNEINSYGYQGYDISPVLIEECNKRFSHSNISFSVGKKPNALFMFTTMSGTYNLAMTRDVLEWEDYIFKCLGECWKFTSEAMIFNLQVSNQQRVSDNNIYFAEPSRVIDRCVSSFGPTRSVKSEELPNDITFTVVNSNLLNRI